MALAFCIPLMHVAMLAVVDTKQIKELRAALMTLIQWWSQLPCAIIQQIIVCLREGKTNFDHQYQKEKKINGTFLAKSW